MKISHRTEASRLRFTFATRVMAALGGMRNRLEDSLSHVNASEDKLNGDNGVLEINSSLILNASIDTTLNDSFPVLALQDRNLVAIINVVVFIFSAVPILCNIFALWMVSSCKKIPPHLKYPSVSLLLSNLLAFTTTVLFQLLVYAFKMKTSTLDLLQYVFTAAFFTVASATVTHMSADRLLAIWDPFLHKRIIKGKVVKQGLCICWVVILTVMVTPSLVTIFVVGENTQDNHLPHTSMTLILLFPALTIFSCIALMCRLNRAGNEFFQRRFYRVTRILVMVIVMYTLLELPFVVHFVVMDLRPDLKEQGWRKLLHVLVLVCFSVNSIFDAFFYTLNIKECKRRAAACIFCGHNSGNSSPATSKK